MTQTHVWLSFSTRPPGGELWTFTSSSVSGVKLWEKVNVPQTSIVWRQGHFPSHVRLPLYEVSGDAVADNIPVMERMNRGFGSWRLSVVLLGKKRTNNLWIIGSTPPSFSINYSPIPPGSLQQQKRPQNSASIVFVVCNLYLMNVVILNSKTG